MYEKFKIWPYLQQIIFPGVFQQIFYHNQIPGRNPGQACDIFINSNLGNFLKFFFKLLQQSNFLVWGSQKISPERKIFDQDGR
ncbi:hypothetical protein ES705_46105 [subsurface metagenome]